MVVVAGLAALAMVSAHAAVFTVTSALDNKDANLGDGICDNGAGACTLRAAIEQANSLGGANTINVPAGTYLLTAALGPLMTSNNTNALVINGTGAAGTVIVDGQGAVQVLQLTGGGSSVSVDNMVLQNGKVTISDPGQTGVCVGGGIGVNDNIAMNLTNSVVRDSQVINGSGGGICVQGGTFTMDTTTVSGNIATTGGAGLRIFGATANINNSTISGNTVTGSPNASNAQGAGIQTQSTVNLKNSTISGNVAQGYGSGLQVVSQAAVTLKNVTIAANVGQGAQVTGGSTESVTAESTIIANPSGGGSNCEPTLGMVSNGHNLDSANTCKFAAPSDIANANPNLGPLQNNGGRTATHAPQTGSIAIDHGSNPSALAFDQRGTGFARVVGAAADIGAFEVQTPGAGPNLDVDASIAATRYDALTDGLLTLRYLFGLTGTSLAQGAVGATATRSDPVAIKGYLDSIRPALDIDGNGTADALTDGLLIIRYLFGLRGQQLIGNAVAANATRTTSGAIETQIGLLVP